jgi:hypothetical protein
MATLTNYSRLPDMMVAALSRNEHEMGNSNYSITQLIKSPRMLQLSRRHTEEVTRDAVDMWNSFIGTCVHGGIYDKIKDNEDYIVEKRIEMQVGDKTIGGTPDVVQKSTKTIFDHKTMQTSAFGLEVKPDYEAQLNIYAYMLEQQGIPIDNLFINAIYLDWRLAAAKSAEPGKYPEAPVRLVPVPKWSKESVESYIEGRVAIHSAAELLEDSELPECSAEECWESQQKLAIYRPGGLRALKLCNNYREVDDWLIWKKIPKREINIVDRPRTRRRCEMYCDAAPFCNQYKEWLAQAKKEQEQNAE